MTKIKNLLNISKFIFPILAIAILLQGCSPSSLSIDSYRTIGASLKKSHNISRGDLVATYDLGKIDNTNCIYFADLGFIINNKYYAAKYLQKFKAHFKHPSILKKEALSKVIRISKLLLKIHYKHRILSNHQHQYVKRLSKQDVRRIDVRSELSRLDEIVKTIPIMLPIDNPQISSPYGRRKHPIKKRRKMHCGIDLVSTDGAPIYSSAQGKVIFAGRKNGYGNVVEIQHTAKIKTIYAHLSQIKVKKGQMIARGISVGRQGQTGTAIKEHLHFEIRINNKHINPLNFIAQAYKCK